MKKVLIALSMLGVLIIAGQTHNAAAATCTPSLRCATPVSSSRSFERQMMLRKCEQVNATNWACPMPHPSRSFMTIIPVNYGGGGDGYSQLPQCGPAYWGQTLYTQGFFWYCASGSNHWVLR
jgi:hypothetical protein